MTADQFVALFGSQWVVDAGLTSDSVTVRPDPDWPLAHHGDVLVKHGTLEVIE